MTDPQRTTRKPLSTRTRFEIFKRDEFTCQYCGRRAPDVVLHVDHIVPLADGGTYDQMNLITSCAECNGGKSDVPLNAVIAPEDPAVRAAEIREQERAMREYNREVMARDARLAEDRHRLYGLLLHLTGWSCLYPADFNWLMSVVEDVPVEVVESKMLAASRSGRPKRAWMPYVKACIRRWREEGY